MNRQRLAPPAPRHTLAETVTVEELVAAILEIRGAVAEIREATVRQSLTVADISRRYLAGRSPDWIRQRPWTLPNFGVPDIPGRPEAWYLATCKEWYSVPMRTREIEHLQQVDRRFRQIEGGTADESGNSPGSGGPASADDDPQGYQAHREGRAVLAEG